MQRFSISMMVSILLLAVAGMSLPSPAFAVTLGSCSGMPPYDIVTSIVVCVQTSVQTSANIIMSVLSSWMQPIVGGMFALAVAIMGARIAGGDPGAIRHATPLLIKLGMVWGYAAMLGNIGNIAYGLLFYLAAVGGAGSTPWGLVDYFMKVIFGYGPSLALYQGLLGLITASLFSGTIGIAVFIAGFIAITSMLSCISRIIFIYLAAIVIVGFMIAISPLFIPMIIFNVTDRYFKQWLNITLSAIIQPMLLFAVCSMFLGIFPTLVFNIFSVTGGNDFRAIWRWNQPLMSWMTPSDPNLQKDLDTLPDGGNRDRQAAIPSYISPVLADAPSMTLYKVPAIDFGLAHIPKMQQLLIAFVALMLFSMLMKTTAELMPQVATDITASLVDLSVSLPIEQAMQGQMGKMQKDMSGGVKDEDSKITMGGKGKGKGKGKDADTKNAKGGASDEALANARKPKSR